MRDRGPTIVLAVLKGNDDEHASVAVAYYLLGWYRNEWRVTSRRRPVAVLVASVRQGTILVANMEAAFHWIKNGAERNKAAQAVARAESIG